MLAQRATESNRRSRRAGADGAAAVEFALVVPLLLMLFFGILDYGMYFDNSLNVRQGVREAARQAVVTKFNDGSTCTTGIPAAQVACTTDKLIGTVNGTAYTKVVLVSGFWAQNQQLVVCSIVKTQSLTGFVPLPGNGAVHSSTRMSIEVVPTSSVPTAGYTEGPATLDWSWCV
jgi:Flp pilus assembly protein TadG